MPPPTVRRKIYFYRADVGEDAGGRPLPFIPMPALQHIGNLKFSPGEFYLDDGDTSLCCWIDGTVPRPRLRLAKIRRSGLPSVERQGQLSNLIIPIDSGLAEVIHIVVFDNIVGVDFNFYGPRISRFSRYLREKGKGLCEDVAFQPLLRQNVEEELKRLAEIRVFHLQIQASYADAVSQADSDLGASFEAARRAGNPEVLELILRPQKYSHSPLGNNILRATHRLARRSDLRTEALKFDVKGVNADTGAVEIVDILRDQLIATEEVLLEDPRGRAIQRQSAYSAIEKAYTALEGQLRLAAGIT